MTRIHGVHFPWVEAFVVAVVGAMVCCPPALGADRGKQLAVSDYGESQAAVTERSAGATLQPGVPQTIALPAAARPTLFTGDYAVIVNVPTGATRLEVRISSNPSAADVDLYIRRGADPGIVNGAVNADFASEGLDGNELIVIDPGGWSSTTQSRTTSPTLQPGPLHIAYGVVSINTAVAVTVVADVTGGAVAPSVDLTGTWDWTAACSAGNFTGQFQIAQSGANLTGTFPGSTHTLVGTVSGNQFQFTRVFTGTNESQLFAGTLVTSIGGQPSMTGTITGTNPPTNCTFTATRSSTGGGGGGAPGGLTIVVTQEDNSECPARRKLVTSVTDSAGQPVLGLGTSNFTVTENGTAVQIQSVVCTSSGGSTAAGSVALVIDRSGSLSSSDLAAEKTAAKALVDQLPAGEAIAVYSFGSTVTVQQAFTTDKAVAKAAIDAIAGGGNTLLYQAIIDASTAIQGRSGRRALVVMTDGQNSGSSPSEADAINAAKAAGAAVFTVGFGSGINQTVLRQIATDTGGVFLSGANSSTLTQLLGQIGSVLSSQCVITYVPVNPAVSATIVVTATATIGGTPRSGTVTRTVGVCAASGGLTGSCPTNALTNGSFEIPAVGNRDYLSAASGYPDMTGWTVSGGGVDIIANLWTSSQGAQSLDMSAGSAGRVAQTIATIAGRQYLVTFDMAGNPYSGAVKRLRVTAGTQSQEYDFDVTGKTAANMGWLRKTFTFTASGSTTPLEFLSLTDTAYGPALDNVMACDAASAGGGGGGGTAPGGLTVVITGEDNSECPARRKLTASVTDSAGQPVTGLGAGNFTITENGQAAQIVSVVCSTAGGSSSAGSVAIVIDRSGSLSSSDLAAEKAAAKALVDQLPAGEAIAIYSFGSTVTVQQAFTTDKAVAKTAIDAIVGGGNTLLYQAIIDASTALNGRSGRRGIVVMTDGQNSGSSPSDTDAINAAKAAGAVVFTVGFGSGINQTVLGRIATETGGVFLSGADSSTLTQLLGRIGTVLTSQCVITYVPVNPSAQATVVLTASDSSTGTQRTGQTTRTVAPCTSSGGGGGGSTTQPGCDYFVRPLEYTFGQMGGTAGGSAPPGTTFNPPVLVTTRPDCRWGSVSNDPSWITLEAGQTGQGDGAVSYRVAANSTGSARNGTVTIAGRTHTVRQTAGSSCSFTITPTASTISASGGFGNIDVIASAGDCTWTAAPQVSWISLNAGQRTAGGRGNATIRFSAGANPDPASRRGTILVAGQTFTVNQNGSGTTGTPTIPDNGVVPAGSGTPPSLPGGAIAQGSFFTIFAFDVGPSNPEQATAYPLPTRLGGTEVLLRQGSIEVNAFIVFTSRSQVNGIIPSNTPTGDVDLIVVYNGQRSNPVRIRVVRNNFNIFTTRAGMGPGIITNFETQTSQPLNTRSTSARPGQVVTIWGNGGGPIAAPDNLAPPVGNLPFDFEVLIGGRPQKLLYYGRSSCCSALDQVVIEISADVPLGCAVPVQARSGGSGAPWSNVATMAISATGAPCRDAENPVSAIPQSGGKLGAVILVKGNALIPLTANAAPEEVKADLGIASFVTVAAGGALGYETFAAFPPVGSCQALAGNQDVSSLLGGGIPGTTVGTGRTELDAGAELMVTGPGGRSVALPRIDTSGTTGPYGGLLGGSLPFPGLTPGPAFLDSGTYRVTGPGGRDVGAFNTTATFPQLVTWTNRAQITSMTRSQGVTVEWSGGGSQDRVLIIGAATDQRTKAGSGFLCVASATDRRFQVPPSVMSNLPATRGAALEDSFGLLGISSLSLGSIAQFSAPGLDMGLIVPGTLELRTVAVQ